MTHARTECGLVMMVAILCRLQKVAKFTISYNSDNPGTVNQAQVCPRHSAPQQAPIRDAGQRCLC